MLIHTDKKAYVVFSLWLRIFHWTMVLSVTALFWTGLYIGDPGFAAITGHPEPTFAIDGWFAMETMRRIHFIAGVILTFSFIFRFGIAGIDYCLNSVKNGIGMAFVKQHCTI